VPDVMAQPGAEGESLGRSVTRLAALVDATRLLWDAPR
jgi:hypothetical protein